MTRAEIAVAVVTAAIVGATLLLVAYLPQVLLITEHHPVAFRVVSDVLQMVWIVPLAIAAIIRGLSTATSNGPPHRATFGLGLQATTNSVGFVIDNIPLVGGVVFVDRPSLDGTGLGFPVSDFVYATWGPISILDGGRTSRLVW